MLAGSFCCQPQRWLYCRGLLTPRALNTANLFRDLKAGPQTVFVKSCAGPGTAIPYPAGTLDIIETITGGKGCQINDRVVIKVLAVNQVICGRPDRIESDEQRC